MLNQRYKGSFTFNGNVRFSMVLVLFLLSFVSILEGADSKRILTDINEIEIAGEQIKKAESKLRNITFDSEIVIERKAKATDKWKKTPIGVLATVWLDGSPGGKFRVDVHSEVLKWHEGAAPFSEESYSVSFDGITAKTAHHHFGMVDGLDDKGTLLRKGEKRQRKTGDIVLGKPSNVKQGFHKLVTGKMFSTNYQSDVRGYMLSDLFLLYKDKKTKVSESFQFAKSIREGKEYLEINSKNTKTKKQTLLDPAKGYALLETSRTYGDQIMSKMVVVELLEVAKGVWFPTHVIFERPTGLPEEPFEKVIFKATNVKANSSDFDETVFDIDFPKDYKIKDRSNEKQRR